MLEIDFAKEEISNQKKKPSRALRLLKANVRINYLSIITLLFYHLYSLRLIPD